MIHHIEQILKDTQKNNSKHHVPFHKNHEDTIVKCIKCENEKGRLPSFRNTASLTKHILKFHQEEKNIPPTFSEVFLVLEKIAVALEKNIPINTIQEVRNWNLEVK